MGRIGPPGGQVDMAWHFAKNRKMFFQKLDYKMITKTLAISYEM